MALIKHWTILASLALVFLIVSCGYQEGTLQSEEVSYLWFTGRTGNAIAIIDETSPIDLGAAQYENEPGEKTYDKLTHYQVAPGKHRIIVKRDGLVVVNRIVILSNGVTKEIMVP